MPVESVVDAQCAQWTTVMESRSAHTHPGSGLCGRCLLLFVQRIDPIIDFIVSKLFHTADGPTNATDAVSWFRAYGAVNAANDAMMGM